MVTFEINGRVIAAEGSVGAAEDAAAMHDMLVALTYGDDVQAMIAERYYGMAACAMMVEEGLSAAVFFADGQALSDVGAYSHWEVDAAVAGVDTWGVS